MSRHIIYIINPVSGTRKKKDLQHLIEKKTAEQKIPFQIFPSVASGDYSFLIPLIKEQKVTDVVIAGGDGTVSQVVGSLLHCDINFGIIPCGSGNGLAYAARIPSQVARSLEIIFNGNAVSIDAFTANDPAPSGTGRHFACMLCGFGFDASVAHEFANQVRRGFTTYIRLVLKHFFAMKKHRFQLQVQDTIIETDAWFISVANSNQFGNHFTIAPKASLSDGLLDIVVVTGKSKIGFIWQTLKQLAGLNKIKAISQIRDNKRLIYFQTDQLTIINHSNALFHIDGEPVLPTPELKIEIKKKCFRLLQPLK